MRFRFALALLVVGGGVQLGCDKRLEFRLIDDETPAEPKLPASAPVQPKPLVVTWTERKGTIEGGGTIEVLALKTNYSITLTGLAEGSRYQVADLSGGISSGSYQMVSVDVRDKLGALALDKLAHVDLGLELSLQLADGRTGKVKLPSVYVDYGLREVLRGVEDGPVLFGPEPADPQPDNCLLWPTGSEIISYGACTSVQGVDWVAVEHELPEEKGRKICGGYKDNEGKPRPDVKLVAKDTEVTVYERRTGKTVDKKSFPADFHCPMFVMGPADEDTKTAYVDSDAIKAWLRAKPKR